MEPQIHHIPFKTHSLFYITLFMKREEPLASFFKRVAAALHDTGASPVCCTALAESSAFHSGIQAMQEACGEITWPATWVEGANHESKPISGLTLIAVSGAKVQPVLVNQRQVGSLLETPNTRQIYLGNLYAANATLPETIQAQQLFHTLREALEIAGMQPRHLVRTTYYLDQIQDWHSHFQKTQHAFYNKNNINADGITTAEAGGANPWGTALTLNAVAVQPNTDQVEINAIQSPFQQPAVQIAVPGCRTLYVSGSITNNQNQQTTLTEQLEQIFDNLETTLHAASMHFYNITRCLVYLNQSKDTQTFHRFYLDRGYSFPAIEAEHPNPHAHQHVCIELEAVSRK